VLIRIHQDNPDRRRVDEAVRMLKNDGVLVVPTDTVYSFACLLGSSKGLDRLARLKNTKPDKANFSLLCRSLSDLSQYTKPVSNDVFKLMKRALPGPYTFILNASGLVPKLFRGNRKTIGIRVPDQPVAIALIEAVGLPLIVSSVHDADEVIEYTTDPELIDERYGTRVDAVIDGGLGHLFASTVFDCTGHKVEIVREGRGPTEGLL
jgi:tRNA threonylcarbamoyl adenosine modification protein (Sua5/YciO/YrdC/YwlC family)